MIVTVCRYLRTNLCTINKKHCGSQTTLKYYNFVIQFEDIKEYKILVSKTGTTIHSHQIIHLTENDSNSWHYLFILIIVCFYRKTVNYPMNLKFHDNNYTSVSVKFQPFEILLVLLIWCITASLFHTIKEVSFTQKSQHATPSSKQHNHNMSS